MSRAARNISESNELLSGRPVYQLGPEDVVRFPVRRIRKALGVDALRVWQYLINTRYESRCVAETVRKSDIQVALSMRACAVDHACIKLEKFGLLDKSVDYPDMSRC